MPLDPSQHPPLRFGGFRRFCWNPCLPLSCRLVSLQGIECPREVFQDTLRLLNELVNPSADGGVDVQKYVDPTVEYYANIRAWRAFEIDTRTQREASKRRESRVQSLLAHWYLMSAVEIESAA